MMIGDGLNDAGALTQSDVGVAVAEDLHLFSPACDAIMNGHTLSRLDKVIRFSQQSISLVKWGYGLSLIYNIVGISVAVQGGLSPLFAAILMPLSSISVVLFAMGSTWLAAHSLFPKTKLTKVT